MAEHQDFAFFNPMNHDEIYLQRCIELAEKAAGNTFPNPLVGCVIVHNRVIIGEGYHQRAGSPHAEIHAIASVKNPELLPESTLYVSLEPCSHYGKTPPCAAKLVEIGFKRVVIGSTDCNEKVCGQGIKLLKQAGIDVTTGVLEKECLELNKRFFTYHEKKRPYILLKWAQSADGFMDKNFRPAAISDEITHQYMHQMRAEEHAILVGTNTALNDNPSLTVRQVSGKNPIRILIDFDLKVPSDFNIFNDEAPTFIFNFVKEMQDGHLTFIKTEREDFLKHLMATLFEKQIQSVMIEGGRNTLQHFIDSSLWDEAVVIHNEHLHFKKGTAAPVLPVSPEVKNVISQNTIYYYKNH